MHFRFTFAFAILASSLFAAAPTTRRSCSYELDVGGILAQAHDDDSGFTGTYTTYAYDDVLAVRRPDIAPDVFALDAPLKPNQVLRFETDHVLKIRVRSEDDRQLEFADLHGRRYIYHQRRQLFRSRWPRTYQLDVTTAGGTGSLPTTPVRDPERTFPLPTDLDAFASELATRHLAQSSTYETANSVARERMFAAQKAVCRAMLDRVRAGRAPTHATIAEWNRTLVQSIEPSSEDDAIFMVLGGLVRGTEGAVRFPQGWTWVDLRRMPMASNFMTAHSVTLARPETVVARLTALEARIAAIDKTTALRDILWTDREFFGVHGFVDGNGRLGRVLFDYGLLTGGFPPRPRVVRVQSMFLFTSLDEAHRLLADAYREEGL